MIQQDRLKWIFNMGQPFRAQVRERNMLRCRRISTHGPYRKYAFSARVACLIASFTYGLSNPQTATAVEPLQLTALPFHTVKTETADWVALDGLKVQVISSPAGESAEQDSPDYLTRGDKSEAPSPCDAPEAVPPVGLLNFIPHQASAFTFGAIYTGEVFTNARGGINTSRATRYRGNLDLTIDGDLDQAFGLTGSTLFIYAGQVHGESLSIKDTGDWQLASNIDPFPYVRLTQLHEIWTRHELFDGQMAVKVGRQDANADFGYADLAGDFVNSSFVTMPTIPLNVWPAQSLGLSTFTSLGDNVTLSVGAYQSNRLARFWGDVVPDDRGYTGLAQLELRTQIGPGGQLPGTWRIGAWVDTQDWQEITTAPVGRVFHNNYGAWFTADQMLWKEEYGTESEQGVGLFVEYGWAPGNRNFVESYYGTGVVYKGLIPGRDQDVLGVGLADIRFGGSTRQRDGLFYESAWELFYKAQLSPFIYVQPDIQYIANPGGNGRDSIFTGVRFELVL